MWGDNVKTDRQKVTEQKNMNESETKFVYYFDEGSKEMIHLLGGKGANLAEMTRLGIPIPPGFVITTGACKIYYNNNCKCSDTVTIQIRDMLKKLEGQTLKKLGSETIPLLVSVRSGAPISMPGMMDSILNIGLNDKTVMTVAKDTGNPRFAWDSYRRLIQMFADVVLKVPISEFERELDNFKKHKGYEKDNQLSGDDLKILVHNYMAIIKVKGKEFPQDPFVQLQMSIDAVFESWHNDRAQKYRQINGISDSIGTAVTIQAMVFGNYNNQSGTGVCFTRNPSTGENKVYGEFLLNAQGEDVVAGIRTPKPIEDLKLVLPDSYKEIMSYCNKLETHYHDMQDIEFTIQDGKLFILQTRRGKRTARAALQVAIDLVDEGLVKKKDAIMTINPHKLDQLLHKQIDSKAKSKAIVIGTGMPASPGAAIGKVVFSADAAVKLSEEGENVILVRSETSPDDIHGMSVSQGILTARGGLTSHAAVVARGMGKCCVCGAKRVSVNDSYFTVDSIKINERDIITLDGSTGEIFKGSLNLVEPDMSGNLEKVLAWADQYRKLGVRTNADTPKDAKKARSFGAEGIGLCRTEHMFFEESRIGLMRQMILATDTKTRIQALDKILPFQMDDFIGIFSEMHGMPVTIRLLDPPLHEFLPQEDKGIKNISAKLGITEETLRKKINELIEFNPMLGHRGCRLAISFPEIAKMQTKAIIAAACDVKKKGIEVKPEIMVPLVAFKNELDYHTRILNEVAKKTMQEAGITVDYKIGTMIEVPRAAMTAGEIARTAEFFSFGTNDLTQMGLGFSRDDANKFIPKYIEEGIFETNPFESLDQEGIGELVRYAVEKGRNVRPSLKIGVCGEHGGEPESIKFFHKIGLDYVSCSPYRVPVARLVAAQAQIQETK